MIYVYNIISKIIFSRYFIDAQGYKIAHKRIIQENKSAMFLEKLENYPVPNGTITSILGMHLLRKEWYKVDCK